MNDKLVKQIEGCPIGGAISVIMFVVNMKRIEKDCVAPLNWKLYKGYVDDTITKKKKNCEHELHHKNIKTNVQTNLSFVMVLPKWYFVHIASLLMIYWLLFLSYYFVDASVNFIDLYCLDEKVTI